MIKEIEHTDFYIKQGETFGTVLTWKDASATPVDLTGYTARMYLKRSAQGEKLFELTTSNGRIALTPLDGVISLSITAADTATLSGVYAYDLEMVQGTYVKRLLQGTITIDNEITR